MCGICGMAFKSHSHPVDRPLLQEMAKTMHHRGPDGEGYFTSPGIGMGIKRLSIIDLDTGDQPMFNEDKSIVTVCNGEIYNYIELRKDLIAKGHIFGTGSDVEVVAHLYEEHGMDFIQYLRGMFSIAIWDSKNKRLVLIRDRIGIKPLYYGLTDKKTLLFASEVKAILKEKSIAPAIDISSLGQFFAFKKLHGEKTFFKNIFSLNPGHFLVYESGQIQIRQYWEIPLRPQNERLQLSKREWIEKLEQKFIETIGLHLRSDVPVSGWLSAGLDSSSVVAIMQKLLNQPVSTFSLSFESEDLDEIRHQKILPQFSGFEAPNKIVHVVSKHFELLPKAIYHREQPRSSNLNIVRMLLSEACAKNHKVAMAGEGADEILGGYRWYSYNWMLRPFSVLPEHIRKIMLLGPVGPKWKPWPSTVFLAPHRMDMIRYNIMTGNVNTEHHELTFLNEEGKTSYRQAYESINDVIDIPGFDQLHPFEQLQYMDIKTRLVDPILLNVDKMAMSQSLEVRVPFLDHEFVELACQIPPELKYRRFHKKYILRKAMENHLPKEICWRKKNGLRAPNRDWLAGPLPDFVGDLLSEHSIKSKGYFDPKAVSNMMDNLRNKNFNQSHRLLPILNVQLLDELFVQC